MLIGNLALTGFGIPFLHIGAAGFYSKDAIIDVDFAGSTGMDKYAFMMTAIAALMTSFYSWRQFLMTFHGRYRGQDADAHGHADEESGHDDHGHHAPKLEEIHEAPLTMLVPLGVLALGALFAGAIFDTYFIGGNSVAFWHGAVAAIAGNGLKPMPEDFPAWVELTPFVLTIAGFLIAFYYYIVRPELPAQMAARKGMLYTFLYNKWYFDELYDFLFVRPAQRFGRFLWKFGDGFLIDGFGPDGISARVLDVTRGAVRLQSGYVYHYAFAMLIGVVVLATWFLFAGGTP
jgi:NADH-quinone oxidoreductase subunit L